MYVVPRLEFTIDTLWVVRVAGEDGELRPWHYIHVYSIESRLMMRVRYHRKRVSIYTLAGNEVYYTA